MKKRRDNSEVLFDIMNYIPGFNREELLEYTKWAVPKLYNSLRYQEELQVRCEEQLINKLNEQNGKFRINKNIDHISIQYAKIFDTIKKDDEIYIQVYLSVYFYDDVDNNVGNIFKNDKYWNDIWIVTYRKSTKTERDNSNCVNCGAVMKYNERTDIFSCEYCGNKVYNKSNSKWEIVDIELGN